MDKIRFGMIGCGGAAVPVADAMNGSAVARLSRTFDLNMAMAQEIAEKSGATACEKLEELLGSDDVDALYIAVPHDKLAGISTQALNAGKAVLSEKPMALNLTDAEALIALADSKNLQLGVFYELRHAKPVAQARELLQAGVLGDIIGVRIQTLIDKQMSYYQRGYAARSENPWRAQKARAGGGLVLMNTSHQLDAFHYLTGMEVESVSAEVATLVASVEVEDTAVASLRYTSGALGSLFAGAHLAGSVGNVDEHFDVYGTQGQLRMPDVYGTGPLKVFLRKAWRDIPVNTWHTIPNEPVNMYAAAIDDFAQAVQAGQPAPTSGRDAKRILAIVLAIYQAAREKRTVTVER